MWSLKVFTHLFYFQKFPCDGNDNVSHTSGRHGIKKTNNNKEYCIKLHLHVKLILCEWKHEPPAWAELTWLLKQHKQYRGDESVFYTSCITCISTCSIVVNNKHVYVKMK